MIPAEVRMTVDDEKAALRSVLTSQREHILGDLEGLSDEDLRRPVLPSRWTCLGLIHHLALDVERFWFQDVFAGERFAKEDGDSNAWEVPPGMSSEAVITLYRDQIDRANVIIDAAAIDQPPANWPDDVWPTWRLATLRAMMLHVITETCLHAGHLDAVRELIDGHQWLVLT
jgi:hypothetical protein